MRLRISDLAVWLDEPEGALRARIAARLRRPVEAVPPHVVVKRSLDCRKKGHPRFLYLVELELPDDVGNALEDGPDLSLAPVEAPVPRVSRAPAAPPIVVGTGPAGLFAALGLVERGVPCLLLERGKAIAPRRRDVAQLGKDGTLDPESNMNFGEGGAGAYTDGKLTTRISHPAVRKVVETFARFGAPDGILSDAKPHIGSDLLPGAVTRLREHLTSHGCEVRFDAKVTDLLTDEAGRCVGVRLADGSELRSDRVILAPGNSARELYETFHEAGKLRLIPKPFAIGFRAEHPQALVDEAQYGAAAGHPQLPPADYRLAENPTCEGRKRGVYSFCMCPGGIVVPTPTEPGKLCVNGMSNSTRSSAWANSGVVVAVSLEDFARDGCGTDALAGLRFQRKWEEAAFALGGGGYKAPAQRIPDYLAGRHSTSLPRSSYRPGLTSADLTALLPAHVTATLKAALRVFDRRLRGYASTEDALLIALESRTSAPLRIDRGVDLQAIGCAGLYPCGEGAGWAGGIVSAAVDGLRVAEAIGRELGAEAGPALPLASEVGGA